MTYNDCLNLILKPDTSPKYQVVDLYAGCGGMSLGFEAAGFDTIGYEKNSDACQSYNANLLGTCFVQNLDLATTFPKADVLISGPPCQPFSVNGNQLGIDDSRNGFPVCISAIEQISPEIFVLENVKGLMGKNRWYLHSVLEQFESLDYQVKIELLNAKHYLVPQNRERIFIIGCKTKKLEISRPENFQVTAGQALGEMAFAADASSKFLTSEMDLYIHKYERASKCIVARDLHLERPSRTLTCRNLGGSTGDMLRISMPDGQRRRLNHREAARLQSFPDWFNFFGNDASIYTQIGNAVPPMMAYHVAKTLKFFLDTR